MEYLIIVFFSILSVGFAAGIGLLNVLCACIVKPVFEDM